LLYHFIFVVKYRKQIVDRYPIKDIFRQVEEGQNFKILKMETDKDHIHMLVETEPKISPLQIVKRLKQLSTVWLWKGYKEDLKKEFWKERTFWSDGYFVCSVGKASERTIRRYIDAQG